MFCFVFTWRCSFICQCALHLCRILGRCRCYTCCHYHCSDDVQKMHLLIFSVLYISIIEKCKQLNTLATLGYSTGYRGREPVIATKKAIS